MTPETFEHLCRVLKHRAGIVIAAEKLSLADVRLSPVARRHGFAGADQLAGALFHTTSEQLLVDVTDAMTTNESFFFRDTVPFDNFRNVTLPHMLAARAETRRLRIWCAACSSGQEPYSLSMILDAHRSKLEGWRVEIVATDISRGMIERAGAGTFSEFEVKRGLPDGYLCRYFEEADAQRWRVRDFLRPPIDFRAFNLMDDPAPLGRFDIVFCRNVLIYFDPATKARVLARVRSVMPDDGFLTLGAAETVIGISDVFRMSTLGRGLYQPNPDHRDRTKSASAVA
jgi:chemotaxis protein methyltransferase CheR